MQKRIKKLADQAVKKLIKKTTRIYTDIKYRIRSLIFDRIINSQSKKNPNFFFVQIGSCDGILGDPIRGYILKHHWSGVLVEPVRYLFDRLLENYRDEKNLNFENSAVSEQNGLRELYRLDRSNDRSPGSWDLLGSLILENVLKHKKSIPDIEDRLVTEKVATVTLKKLIEKYGIKAIDLLHIDAEGYDYEILKQIDFINIKPKMILFENIHLTKSDYEAGENLLRDNGYAIIRMKKDTFSVLR